MRTYTFLSHLPLLSKRFPLKILFVAFVGIHIPLFAIIGYLLISRFPIDAAKTIGLLTLVFTLLATGITLFLLNKLLKPVMIAKNALNDYIAFSKTPDLPLAFEDEAGVLMADVQQAINELEKYEEERQNVLHVLSHDLQSPVRTAMGALALLEDETDPEQRKELEGMLKETLDKQLKQLRYYLQLLKEQKLNSELDAEKVSIPVPILIGEVAKDLHMQMKAKGIDLAIGGFEGSLALPKHSLQRVLKNVLDNAIKYSNVGGNIEISAIKEEHTLKIAVKDYGVGFNESCAKAIFAYNSPLQRLGTSNEPSTGIGMYLCKNMMRRIGGEISAASEGKGKGATFTIIYTTRS
ncbi:sensor histidine kinase [Roseivirga pacifica]|uniref:sensor histidine kinase n=1 Tax=Roseivirga pacifica TaxID=1267423 RepID=UPI00227C744E